jgi:adenylate cyclase
VRDQVRRATRRGVVGAMRSLPGPVVRQMVHVWAPLARYGGTSKGGAYALSRAIRVLAEPPLTLRGRDRLLSAADIGSRLGRSEEEVARWAGLGLLGEPDATAPEQWGPAGVERARLIDYLRRHGVGEDELRDAAAQNRLPLLIIDRTVTGRATMSIEQVAQRTGISADFAARIWRALGLPPGEPGEVICTRRDLEAMRIVAAMGGIFSEAEIVEAASVLGLAMAQVAGSQVDLFRRSLNQQITGSVGGNLDHVLRSAAMVDLMLPTAAQLMEVVHRRHIEAAVRGESVVAVELATGALPGQVELCIGFADLVGFTAASDHLAPMDVGEMAGALVHHAEGALPAQGARIVKTIGDAVMFTAPDPGSGAAAALALLDAASADAKLPPLRVGLAFGPVLRRYGDYFGRTVNVASRLCTAASPGAVLLHCPAPVDAAAWSARGVAAGRPVRLRVKGIEDGVEAVPVRRAG